MRPKTLINHLLCNYYYFHRKIILRNKPRVWAIELTNYCNLTCLMCPRRFMKRKVGFMKFSLFKDIIEQGRAYTDFVWLHLFGESLFHPQLKQFIDCCSENNIKSGLSTNATILDKEKALVILNSKLDHINLCIDGSTKETFEKLRQGGDFDKTRSNIMNFLELKKKFNKTKPFAEIQMIRMKETENEIDAFKKQWKDLADTVTIKDFCAWAGQVEGKPDKSYRTKRYPCINFWRDGVIMWNGDFSFCCMDVDGELVVGNLGKEELKNIWNSPKTQKIRKEQVEDNYNILPCKNCAEWSGYQKDIFYPYSRISPHTIRFLKNLSLRKQGLLFKVIG